MLRSLSAGFKGRTTSMVMSVDAELSIEAMDTMVEAMKPATTSPMRPAGNNRKIKVG
jgi:hypothetical protein